MYEKQGKKVALTLTTGDSIAGEVRRWWIFGAVRLTHCHVQTPAGAVEVEGMYVVPRRSISHYQREA